MLAVEHSADDAVPQPHTRRIYEACVSRDKTMHCIQGATHYFSGQPQLLDQAARLCISWMQQRRLLD